MAIVGIFKSFHEILEVLEYIAEDQTQKGDVIREAKNIADNM